MEIQSNVRLIKNSKVFLISGWMGGTEFKLGGLN